ncbi:Os02g0554725 [Oryza sativa Japonica Group]|uniref:Os02g0554725 protein n=1 Tax=Oryza sativa subsp. japonica TaxID=39947 RepID=A0A0P0VK99_ORYSJ|nr:Os02g0554725 [Oryza sativa Japonica Group]
MSASNSLSGGMTTKTAYKGQREAPPLPPPQPPLPWQQGTRFGGGGTAPVATSHATDAIDAVAPTIAAFTTVVMVTFAVAASPATVRRSRPPRTPPFPTGCFPAMPG